MSGIFSDPAFIPGKTPDVPRERPILFSGALVRAILAGTKTQTRRIVDMRDVDFIGPGGCNGPNRDDPSCWGYEADDGRWYTLDQATPRSTHQDKIRCPYGAHGDSLWVRETWATVPWNAGAELHCPEQDHDEQGVRYRATWDKHHSGPWRPSIFMRRWASRITLRVEGVRAERLQDITEDDARAEGLALEPLIQVGKATGCFARLWDEINGKRAPWGSNPFVWVVGFSVAEVRGRVAA